MKELFISQATYLKRKTKPSANDENGKVTFCSRAFRSRMLTTEKANDENGKVTFCSRALRSRMLTKEKAKLKVKLWSQIDISNLSMFLFFKRCDNLKTIQFYLCL